MVEAQTEGDAENHATRSPRSSQPSRADGLGGARLVTLVPHVRHRGLRRSRPGAPDRDGGSPAARVPRLRLGGCRGRGRGRLDDPEASRQARRARGALTREPTAPAATAHGPHAVGDARRPHGRQRPPAPRLHRTSRRGPQRDRREPSGAAGRAGERRPRVRVGDRHRGRRTPARGRARETISPRPSARWSDAPRCVLARGRCRRTIRASSSASRSRPRSSSGLGAGETVLASDIPAVLGRTRRSCRWTRARS